MQKICPILIAGLIQLCLACASLPPPVVDKIPLPPPSPPPQAAPQAPPAAPMAPLAPEEKPVIPVAPPVVTPQANSRDEELFLQGLQQLVQQVDSQEADGPARLTFETLISTYPSSKWRAAAQVGMRLLEALDAYRDQLRTEQAMVTRVLSDRAKSLQETEQLKRELRTLMEKYQAELTALQQENEQLRKDIQLLKNLELQRDRREKMLR